MKIDENWWPSLVKDLPDLELVANEYATVALIDQPWKSSHAFLGICTAVVPTRIVDDLLTYKGELGWEVSSTGPHSFRPNSQRGETYLPRFWIHGGELAPDGLESLVVSWSDCNTKCIGLDHRFLMTYGLMPRFVKRDQKDEIHWDDVSAPLESVAVVQPLSKYNFPTHEHAEIRVRCDYLEDYATLRSCSLVQAYYAENWGAFDEEEIELLDENGFFKVNLPGRIVHLQTARNCEHRHLVRMWGVRRLLDPGSCPITDGRSESPELSWPGQDITSSKSPSSLWEVFVSDSVLGAYEGDERFSIYPPSGAVSYENQWSVSNTRRIGRDVIAVEKRKLYEGTPPDVVRHWHKHAVEAPKGNLVELMGHPNIGSRTERIIKAQERVDAALMLLVNEHEIDVGLDGFIGLKWEELNYNGWWNEPLAERAARHVPSNIKEEEFLIRCRWLHGLVVETFSERALRRTLLCIGVDEGEIQELRSLKLLNKLIVLKKISLDSGLSLDGNIEELERRSMERSRKEEVPGLFVLSRLRIVASHNVTQKNKIIHEAIEFLRMNKEGTRRGWGDALDRMYDVIAQELEDIKAILIAH